MIAYFTYPLLTIVIAVVLGAVSPPSSLRRKFFIAVGNFALFVQLIYVLMWLMALGYRDIVRQILA